MSDLPTRYQPTESDQYSAWEDGGAFEPSADLSRETFTMLLPPPNITGQLHMGHAYEHTISDAFIRRRRMEGLAALWLPGTDHAGIATQNIIERQLAQEGSSRHELGREAFLERAWEWKESSGGMILNQMRSLGASPDWSRLRFTMDDGAQEAIHTLFFRLHEDGLIYRAERITPWCPRCATALSDIELEGEGSERTCSRCGARIEERSSQQWFLSTKPLADRAREAYLSGELRISPPEMGETYLAWLDQMHDWCISRQLWWGHRIPIWYGPDGQERAFAPGETIPEGWTQDEDILDTWFSSGLWPLTTLGWPHAGPDMDRFYPGDLMITGYDLIFFWIIRMMMLCTYAADRSPFKHLYLHGMIRDENGKKMSKSFGNAQDPLEWIEEYGADALRWALSTQARPGSDIPFGRSDLDSASSFLKKLWSIARLQGSLPPAPPLTTMPEHALDGWLLARLERMRSRSESAWETFDLAAASSMLAEFIEGDLSDRYLEAAKPRLRSMGPDGDAARGTFLLAWEECMRLLHPFIPFLSERLWNALGHEGLLTDASWPTGDPSRMGTRSEATGDAFWSILGLLRTHRSMEGISQHTTLSGHWEGDLGEEMLRLGRLRASQEPLAAASFSDGEMRLSISSPEAAPLDRSKLEKKLDETRLILSRTRSRLEDPGFLAKAPQAAIDKAAGDARRLAEEEERILGLLGRT